MWMRMKMMISGEAGSVGTGVVFWWEGLLGSWPRLFVVYPYSMFCVVRGSFCFGKFPLLPLTHWQWQMKTIADSTGGHFIYSSTDSKLTMITVMATANVYYTGVVDCNVHVLWTLSVYGRLSLAYFCSTLSNLKAKGSQFVTTNEELSKIKLSRFRLEKLVR